MKNRKIFSIALALVFCLALTPAVPIQAGNEVSSTTVASYVPKDLVSRPQNEAITGSEVTRLAVRWLEYATGKTVNEILSEKKLVRDPAKYASVTSDSDLLAAFALSIVRQGFPHYGGMDFTPNGNVTREDAAELLYSVIRVAGVDVNMEYGSQHASRTYVAGAIDLYEAENQQYIHYVRSMGIMDFTSTNPPLFSPKAACTREMAITAFSKIDIAALTETAASRENPTPTAFTLTETQVYDKIMAMKSVLKDGMAWDNDVVYCPHTRYSAAACNAFTELVSDAVFGNLPRRELPIGTNGLPDLSKLRVGDEIFYNYNAHTVIVLAIKGDTITVAEGNNAGKVRWGRTISIKNLYAQYKKNVDSEYGYVLEAYTRYPQ